MANSMVRDLFILQKVVTPLASRLREDNLESSVPKVPDACVLDGSFQVLNTWVASCLDNAATLQVLASRNLHLLSLLLCRVFWGTRPAAQSSPNSGVVVAFLNPCGESLA